MKLDISTHIFPKKYYARMLQVAPNGQDMHKRVRDIPSPWLQSGPTVALP
jgi:hypothetical protein